MRQSFASSGSVLADKRYAYGDALLAEGDAVAAADLFAQAIEQAPDWAPAYLAWGLALEQAGAAAKALTAIERAHVLDRDGTLGTALHRARLTGSAPNGMSPAYVAALFDQYAPRFESHLVAGLAYRGPQVIAALIDRAVGARRIVAALDLGCGTGLMAKSLTHRTAEIDGIDLSTEMLKQAAATSLYGILMPGECVAVMRGLPARRYDLVVAADVLVYLGDLRPIFEQVGRLLREDGIFAGTVEAAEAEDYRLGGDLRFRHSPAYIRRILAEAGLSCAILQPCVTRTESGRDVPGLAVLARTT
ncbi:class I SAM-dependent DNA methyltransferase [Lichenifustis flavocetrariae]|uniref:Methyltransferase n=1 Tax=Lichenifustis flavocetrariae TaxID=2949735 RepID=A0AA41YRF2_9HYPH|nr:methyltransferase [Lichenifustis flavocetrariae]MCW6506789.1 methyltransferase [Lichenifustis flavocetrariae]